MEEAVRSLSASVDQLDRSIHDLEADVESRDNALKEQNRQAFRRNVVLFVLVFILLGSVGGEVAYNRYQIHKAQRTFCPIVTPFQDATNPLIKDRMIQLGHGLGCHLRS